MQGAGNASRSRLVSLRHPVVVTETERNRVGRIYGRYGASGRRARNWDSSNRGNNAIRDELAERLLALVTPELSRGPLLDVGCGNGWWLQRLTEAGVPPDRLSGVDILPERVAAARTAVAGADIREGDARTLGWNDATFAVVTLLTVLSSLGDSAAQRATLEEAVRVTRSGGIVATWEPRWPALRSRERRRVPVSLHRGVPRVRASVETITLLPPLARRLGRQTASLYPALVRMSPLRSHRLVILRKP
jgi:SAM-dependent methyltransferase